jgi:ribosomal protein S27E
MIEALLGARKQRHTPVHWQYVKNRRAVLFRNRFSHTPSTGLPDAGYAGYSESSFAETEQMPWPYNDPTHVRGRAEAIRMRDKFHAAFPQITALWQRLSGGPEPAETKPFSSVKGQTLTDDEGAALSIGQCPDCRHTSIVGGPRGGATQNMACGHCGSEFNYVFGFGHRNSDRGKPDHDRLLQVFGISLGREDGC